LSKLLGCISNFRSSFLLWLVGTSAAGGLFALAGVFTRQRKFEMRPNYFMQHPYKGFLSGG
jgi:hypothetical protein